MLGSFFCLYSPHAIICHLTLPFIVSYATITLCYLMVRETIMGLEHIINIPSLSNVPCSPVNGPYGWILIQYNCAWWNYISYWHTGMTHPATWRPTRDSTESWWLLTLSCQTIDGNSDTARSKSHTSDIYLLAKPQQGSNYSKLSTYPQGPTHTRTHKPTQCTLTKQSQ